MRAELPLDLLRQRRLRRLAAGRAHDVRTLVFGNVSFDGRQLGHLMPSRLTRHRPAARQQAAVTMPTRVWKEFDHLIDALERDQRPTMAGMPWLATWLSTALGPPASHALVPGESVRRRRFRGRCRVLLTQRQLAFQIGDLLLRFRDLLLGLRKLPIAFSQFATQAIKFSLQLLIVRAATFQPRHASHGTPIASICTDRLNRYVHHVPAFPSAIKFMRGKRRRPRSSVS